MLTVKNQNYIGDYHLTSETKKAYFLSDEARSQHVYILGQTGVGKSTFIRQLIAQDIAQGKGVALIDIHGDLAEEVLACVPPERARDVIYFDGSSRERPIGFNPLLNISEEHKSLATDNIISALRNFWGHSWGDRMEYVLKNCILALLDCPSEMGVSFLSISRLLTDKNYRHKVQRHIKNKQVASYWRNEFALYPERFKQEVISPVLNKINVFSSDPLLRNIVGQWENKVDIERVMNTSQIFIADLSKGKMGAKNANLLGSLLVSSFQQSALKRAFMPKKERVPFYMFIDEFQNFTTDEFAGVFSEARKYGLSLAVGHQYLGQLSSKVRSAVSGNVANMVLFALSAKDALELLPEFELFKATDFTNLGRGKVIARFQGGGGQRGAPIRLSLNNFLIDYGRAEKLKKQSIRNYGRSLSAVDAYFEQWYGG